jgi:hypothetical protein
MSDIYETDIDRILADNIIFRSVTGSKAYGLDTVTSDTDIRGVYISPPGARLGLFYTEQKRGEIDDTHFCDVSQFFKHVVTGAPNWVESLFASGSYRMWFAVAASHGSQADVSDKDIGGKKYRIYAVVCSPFE